MKINKVINESELINKYVNDKRSISLLSQDYKCGQGKIKRILEKNNIPIRGLVESSLKVSTYIPESEIDNIISLHKSGLSTYKIADQYKCHRTYLSRFMKRHGYEFDVPDIVEPILIKNKQLIIDTYNKEKLLDPVAKQFNCSTTTISRFLDKQKLKRKHKVYKYDFALTDIDKMKKMYTEGQSTIRIAKEFRCTPPTIRTLFKQNNIQLRTSQQANILYGGTEEMMDKVKKSCFKYKQYTLPSGRTIKLRGYEPQFLDHVFTNNLLKEEDFDFNTIQIKYTHDYESHRYYPDFYIPKLNLIVEIKSKYILEKQGVDCNKNKKLAVLDGGYNYILILDNEYTEFDSFISKKLNN